MLSVIARHCIIIIASIPAPVFQFRPKKGQEAVMALSAQFVKHLRVALNNLYEPDRLRRNPLTALLGISDRPDAFTTMQRILIDAIDSLQPQAQRLPRSSGWEVYEPLFYRYVQRLSQRQVSRQLGMSVRHLRRKEYAALEVLAGYLWRRFDLETKVYQAADEPSSAQTGEASNAVSDELAWLRTTPVESPTDLNHLLPDVIQLTKPLAAQHRVHLDCHAPDLPSLAVHPVAVTQILMNLLSVAIHRCPGGNVSISARPLPAEVEIRVRTVPIATEMWPLSENDAASLDLTQQLTSLCGGKLAVSDLSAAFQADLALPARQQVRVLVIDDNADTLQLLRRYTTDSRYWLITTQDPQQALSLAQRFSPQIIVLDVMMPHIDGWRVLGQLRQHPVTEHVPIIICTILAQEEMAYALGASGFVRKPVTRAAFLACLDQQVELLATKPG